MLMVNAPRFIISEAFALKHVLYSVHPTKTENIVREDVLKIQNCLKLVLVIPNKLKINMERKFDQPDRSSIALDSQNHIF